jgi:hypothetical protein
MSADKPIDGERIAIIATAVIAYHGGDALAYAKDQEAVAFDGNVVTWGAVVAYLFEPRSDVAAEP